MKNKRHLIKYLFVPLTLTAFCACKTMPEVDQHSGSTIAVVSSGVQRQNSVESVSRGVEGSENTDLERHISAMAGGDGPALIKDNAVRLLIDGPKTYSAMFDAIAAARSNINLEVYIFESDELGNKLKNVLIERQREGITVRVIYDSFGCLSTPAEFFQEFRDAGIQVAEFNPVDPTQGKLLDLNNRDHRKLLIVDGKIAFTGGINVSSVYSHGSSGNIVGRNAQHKPPTKSGWRDTQIEVKGPVVAELQRIFFDTWNTIKADAVEAFPVQHQSNNSDRKPSGYYSELKSAGNKLVRVVASSPEDDKNIIYTNILIAVENSRKTVHITMAYFSPDEKIMEALCKATNRHVDVALVLPGFSDVWSIFEAGRSHYAQLLKCGVKIYERHDALLHAKTVVIDGVWSTVGSSNMDMRSFLHNREVNVIVLGSEFAAEMEAMFQHDVSESRLITAESWRQRPLTQRMGQWIARIFSYWL